MKRAEHIRGGRAAGARLAPSVSAATEFLRAALLQGPRLASELAAEADALGIGLRALQRATDRVCQAEVIPGPEGRVAWLRWAPDAPAPDLQPDLEYSPGSRVTVPASQTPEPEPKEEQMTEEAPQSPVRRVHAAWDAHRDGDLTEKTPEARWGTRDGVTIIRSAATRAGYLIDAESGRFFRTTSPGEKTLEAASPGDTIREDRAWLFRLLPGLPGGPLVLSRYTTRPAAPVAAPAAPAPAPPPAPAPAPYQAPIRVERVSRKLVIEESTARIELAPHEVHALLRRAGIEVPDRATVTLTNQGYVRVSWTETRESVEEA